MLTAQVTFALLHRCRGILSRDLLLGDCFRPSRAPGATSLHLLPVPLCAPTAANSSYEDGCAEIQEGVWRKVSSFHKVEDAYFFLKPRRKIPALCLKIIILSIEVNLRFSFFFRRM